MIFDSSPSPAEALPDEIPQLVNRELGGVDDQVRHGADGRELRALGPDAAADRSVRAERMRAARLAEAADDGVVVRLQEDQPRVHRLRGCSRRPSGNASGPRLRGYPPPAPPRECWDCRGSTRRISGSARPAGCRPSRSRGPPATFSTEPLPEPLRPVMTTSSGLARRFRCFLAAILSGR